MQDVEVVKGSHGGGAGINGDIRGDQAQEERVVDDLGDGGGSGHGVICRELRRECDMLE